MIDYAKQDAEARADARARLRERGVPLSGGERVAMTLGEAVRDITVKVLTLLGGALIAWGIAMVFG